MALTTVNPAMIGQTSTGSSSLTATGSGAASLITAAGTALSADSSGRVTQPFQPAFLAGNANLGDTTFTQGAVIPFDTTSGGGFNIGNHYNTSTYRFTAPVAGRYVFTCTAFYTNSGGFNAVPQIAPLLNGSQLLVGGDATIFHCVNPNSTGGQIAIGGSFVLNLAVNDYVQVYTRANNARLYMGHTKFSGYLVG